jgi:dTDP-4-dehydrorhamnose reductase
VISCAAYTQVDKAEEDRALAFLINRDSARAVPSYSVLNKEKIRTVLDYNIPHWRQSLTSMLEQMSEL